MMMVPRKPPPPLVKGVPEKKSQSPPLDPARQGQVLKKKAKNKGTKEENCIRTERVVY